ncbi:Gurmarin/antifungal peptide [Penicillium roqueforti FM164]|uniref:Gurmarin/antifungal peptide n=1 Tax=Penicillium roqueforti (strain FM164) TaxID=1365484 RepID=W6PZI9_PENRF|nr:Gurmarin/antifungal peptide [Penicillium roqueforti FM164]
MRLTFIVFMAIIGAALAADKAPPTIQNGSPCKADGSAGICASGFCLQLAHDNEGVCK